MIYLDNSATSYPKPREVYDKLFYVMKNAGGNAGRGGHRLSDAAAGEVFAARENVARLFNISDSSRVCFVAGATLGLNYAVKGTLLKNKGNAIISDSEHNSVLRPIHAMSRYGVSYTPLPCEEICQRLTKEVSLVVVNHVSNVTGDIADIKQIGEEARRNGSVFVVDASQSAGHIDIDVERDNIDILVCAGHKGLFGPQGSGVLYVREGVELDTIIEGGSGSMSELLSQPDIYPDKFEAGTVNAPGIAALGAGVKYILNRGIDKIHKHEMLLTRMLTDGLSSVKGVTVYGKNKDRAGVVGFNIEGRDSVEVAAALNDEFGIMVRGGLHCAYLAHKSMGTLDTGCVRASVGYFNTPKDILNFIYAIDRMA